MTNVKVVTRKELYDLVWTRPLRDVAKDFGLSDVGLAKTCTRHDIPKPPRGYWAQVQAGWKIARTPLPDAKTADAVEIEIRATLSTIPAAARDVLVEAKKEVVGTENKPTFTVRDGPIPIEDLHPKLKPTARTLRKAKPDSNGAIFATLEDMCGVVVSTAQAERAISILDALFTHLDANNLTFNAMDGAVRVSATPDSLAFSLHERTRREKHTPTAEELLAEERRKKKLQSRWTQSRLVDLVMSDYKCSYPEYDTIYTGELAIEISGGGAGLRRRWADGKQQKLEAVLDDIVIGIRANLAAAKANREGNERRQREWAHLQHRRDLARQRADRENKRLTFLQSLVERQLEIQRLGAVLENASALRETSPSLAQMFDWVEARHRKLLEAATPGVLTAALEKANLFPENDVLFDPEGEPPTGYLW